VDHPPVNSVALPNAVDSGFLSPSLDASLVFLQARTLIRSDLATDICVLFTTNDAYMCGYTPVVAEDCVAADTAEASRHAFAQVREALTGTTCPSTALRL
jgi:nicotinamidase-related amidase